jgi:hypothetical protein
VTLPGSFEEFWAGTGPQDCAPAGYEEPEVPDSDLTWRSLGFASAGVSLFMPGTSRGRFRCHLLSGAVRRGRGPWRCRECGHRLEPCDAQGRVVETRTLGPAAWLREIPGRLLARRARG